jgi:hypothetical protein
MRIVMNDHVGENATKKKKHTGYAFIVFEREKDMKGKAPQILPPQSPPTLVCRLVCSAYRAWRRTRVGANSLLHLEWYMYQV